jgi:predicted transcriptional regulator
VPTDQKAFRVYLPRDLADELEQLARAEDRPVSRLFREAVRMLLRKRAEEQARQ